MLRKWKKEDWAVIEGMTVTDNGRPYSAIAIGENESNGVTSHITEEMYTDIFDFIQQKRPEYKVYVNYNEFPRIVIYFNGKMINSNNSFRDMKAEVEEMLKKIFIPDVLKAYFDFKKGGKATPSIEILRNRIKELSGAKETMYQLMFLKPIVEDYVMNYIMKMNTNELSTLPTHEFSEVVAAMMYKKINSHTYNRLVEANGEEVAKEMVINDLARRYMKGGQ